MKNGAPVRPFDLAHVARFFDAALFGMLASGYLAVLSSGALDLPVAVLAALALLFRLFQIAGLVALPVSQRSVNHAAIFYVLFYPIDYFFLSRDFLASTVHMIFFVAVVKMISASTARDHFFLMVIAFLELLAASLLSNSLSFFSFLVVFLCCSVAAFASMEILRSARGRLVVTRGAGAFSRRPRVLPASTVSGIIILTAALFFVLPRTARAALERFLPHSARISGFSNEVSIGQTGEIRRQTTPVLHIQFQGSRPPTGLKWRGAALAEFNGWKWYNSQQAATPRFTSNGSLRLAGDDSLRRASNRASYEVTASAAASDAVFIAGRAIHLQLAAPFVYQTTTGGFRLPRGGPDPLRYTVFVDLGDGSPVPAAEPMGSAQRDFYLRLPWVDRRIEGLAREITAGRGSDIERARAIEEFLKTRFHYSLDPLREPVDDPLAWFLFDRRAGHCEYFASAMAVLLRMVWVPARVVTGFQGGELNPLSDRLVLRASDAHSWVEAWIPGLGWKTFDPTPPDLNPPSRSLWSSLGLYLDAADTFWQEWVVGYDQERQLTLAMSVERSRRLFSLQWADDAWSHARSAFDGASDAVQRNFLPLLTAAAAAVALWKFSPRLWHAFLARRRRRRAVRGEADASDAALLYLQLLTALKRRGLEKPAWMTPREFASHIPAGAMADAVGEFTTAYNGLRFGRQPRQAARLASLLEQIEAQPRQ